MSDSSKIKDAADALVALSESVPVYKDAVQPGAVEIGKALGTIGKAVNAALAPLRLVVWGYEQIEAYLTNRVSDELADVPPERIISPDLIIAGPAVEAMKFAGHKAVLREMYARLLARAMDSDTAPSAHPAFVEIIKQMTPDEAKAMRFVWKEEAVPLITVNAKHIEPDAKISLTSNVTERLRNFSLVGYLSSCEYPKLAPAYLDNLARLKLIDIRDLTFSDESKYEPLEAHDDLSELVDEIENTPEREVHFKRHVASITELGRQFCSICMSPPDM
ncbi:DUF4393 domain-containing protein [Rubrivirga sp.]|uniref:DUF4393 domain-containing protein n=1 Tax=Rubrivirga sp. TaxID=1885344 RepID=UPI003B51D495